MWHGKQPNNTGCKVFRCRAYVYGDKKQNKLRKNRHSETAIPGIFLGYTDHLGHPGYCVISDDLHKLYVSTHVTWVEGKLPFRPVSTTLCVDPPTDVFGDTLETMIDDTNEIPVTVTVEEQLDDFALPNSNEGETRRRRQHCS